MKSTAKTQELAQEHKHEKARRKRLLETLNSFQEYQIVDLDKMLLILMCSDYDELHTAIEQMDTEHIVYVIETLIPMAWTRWQQVKEENAKKRGDESR